MPAGEAGEAKAVGEGEATAGVGANGTAWPTAVEQYEALRRELYLYNPDYLARPHIVALNKLDLPLQRGGQAAFDEARARLTQQIAASAAAAAAQVRKQASTTSHLPSSPTCLPLPTYLPTYLLTYRARAGRRRHDRATRRHRALERAARQGQ